jgi:gliding motility-associated-like protein
MKTFYSTPITWVGFILAFIQSQVTVYATTNLDPSVSLKQLEGNTYQVSLVLCHTCNPQEFEKTTTLNIASRTCSQSQDLILKQVSSSQDILYTGDFTLPGSCTDWKINYTNFEKSNSLYYSFSYPLNDLLQAAVSGLKISSTAASAPYEDVLKEAQEKHIPETDLSGYLQYRMQMNRQLLEGSWQQSIPSSTLAVNPSCTNVDFETGNLNGWSGTTGFNPGCCPTPGFVAGRQTITTGAGVDACGGFPVVCPGGSYSMMLGAAVAGGLAEQIMQTFIVSAGSTNYTYKYAVVLQDPGHLPADQPYFKIEMLDQNGNPIACSAYFVAAGQNIPGFINSTSCPGVIYKPWTAVSIDLSAYVGQQVTIRFSAADCTLGGHYGYAYLDGSCMPLSITASGNLCVGSSITLTAPAGSAAYSWSPGGQTTQSITVTAGGNYSCLLTSVQGCTMTLNYNVVANPVPLVQFTPAAGLCSPNFSFTDQSTISSGSITAWNWNFGDSNGSALQNPTHTYTPGTYTVTLQTTSAMGCTDSSSQVISIPIPPTISLGSTPVRCFGGNTGSATVTVNSGLAPYTYSWSNGGTAARDSNLTSGTYSVTVTTASGCTVSGSITITQPAFPLAVTTTQVNASCFNGSNGSSTATPSGGTGSYTYYWNTTPSQSTPTAINLAYGSYTVAIADSNGCLATAAVNILQPPPVIGTFSAPANVSCNGGNNGSVTAVGSGGVGPYQYTWNTTPVQTTATATNLSAGNHQVTIVDANGCTFTMTTTLTQPSVLVNSVIATNGPACFGGSNGNASSNASGGTAPYQYSWNSTPPQFSANAVNLPAGTFTLTTTDSHGCVTTLSVTINQPSAVVAGTSGISNVTCNGGNNGWATGTAGGGTGPYLYSWSTVPVQTSATALNLHAGTYILMVTDHNGCSANVNVNIVQPGPIMLTTTGATTICAGLSTGISASASGGNGTYTYSWSNALSNASSHVVTPPFTTNYYVSVTDNAGCAGPVDTIRVRVINLNLGNLAMSPPATICYGASVSVAATISGDTGPITYSWSNGLGTTAGPFNVSPSNTTTYTVGVTNSCGVTIHGAVTITVNPLPVVALQPQSGASCDHVSLQMQNTASNPGASYAWNFGDGNTSTQEVPQHDYFQSGSYTVTLTVTSSTGCVRGGNTINTIMVYTPTVASFTCPEEASELMPEIQFTNTSSNAASNQWDFGDNSFSTTVSPLHVYASKGTYKVMLKTTSPNGCLDTVSKIIEIAPEFTFFIPNAFTPDGNGRNDVFNGKGEEIIGFQMMIFDRWGELIFTSEDQNKGWDGRANNGSEIAQEGVYVYKFIVEDFKGKKHYYDGAVALVK